MRVCGLFAALPGQALPRKSWCLQNRKALQMDPATHHTPEVRERTAAPADFVPLHLETRTHVDTATAAYHLMRRPQTLRGHACHEDGPIRPHRINGRLAWDVASIRRVLGVPA